MIRILISLIFLLQSTPNHVHCAKSGLLDPVLLANCSSFTDCSACLRNFDCVWCADPKHEKQMEPIYETFPRCQTREQIKTVNCNGFLENFTSTVTINKQESLRFDDKATPNILISPQKITLELRPNDPQTFKMEYQDPGERPLDVYHLMEHSMKMEEAAKQMAQELANELQKLPSNLALGFGSFFDKPMFPFFSQGQLDGNDYTRWGKSVIPYSFKNHLKLQTRHTDLSQVKQIVNRTQSFSRTKPEGILDALMQVMACKDEIGWRDNARRLIVVWTASPFRNAGNGEVAGIVMPNDLKCHMDAKGRYTHWDRLDYPSIAQINTKAMEEGVLIVFVAVGGHHFSLYTQLAQRIQSASAVQLFTNSTKWKVVPTIPTEYQKIKSTVVIRQEPTRIEGLEITYTCENQTRNDISGVAECPIKPEAKQEFTITVKLTDCSRFRKHGMRKVTIFPATEARQTLELSIHPKCDCVCANKKKEGHQSEQKAEGEAERCPADVEIAEPTKCDNETAKDALISSQIMKMELRANDPKTFKMEYQDPSEKPLDLYYLMDLSHTMNSYKTLVANQAQDLAGALQNLTENINLGFGSFVDKPMLPFARREQLDGNFFTSGKKAEIPYSFKNHLKLQANVAHFKQAVNSTKSSANFDNPEATLDALMQVMACKNEIGWRDNARRFIVVCTDGPFHTAGDGEIAGILTPNDMKCHMENGNHTHYDKLDYPSIAQINKKATEENVHVIFAVTESQLPLYKQLARHIQGANAVELTRESGNFVQTVSAEYARIKSTLQIRHEPMKIDGLEITYTYICENQTRQSSDGVAECYIKPKAKQEFNITVKLTDCGKFKKHGIRSVKIFPTHDSQNQSLELDFHSKCDYNCDLEPRLVFGTVRDGLKAYVEWTKQVNTMIQSTEQLNGVAWNPVQQQLYFFSPKVVYRACHDGTNVQTVLQADKYKYILAIALDWITGNLYGVNHAGDVFVCNTEAGDSLKCANILRRQGRLHGIAVDPDQGTMYVTTYNDARRRGSILRAGMDGSGRTEIVKGLESPGGIVIDHSSSKLFWADNFANRIQSSDLDGENVETVATLQDGAKPWGIIMYDGRLFWGNYQARTLRSANKTGGDIQTVYRAASSVTHLTSVTQDVPKFSRRNDCDGLGCSNICVLTPASATCMG